MRTSLVAIFLCIVAVSAHSGFDELVQAYGRKKIMQSCFGESKMQQKKQKMLTAIKECKQELGQPAFSTQALGMPQQFASYFGNVRTPGSQGPLFIPVPVYAGAKPLVQGRKKRAVYFTEEKIRETKEFAVQKRDMALCTLQKIGVLTQGGLEVVWPKIQNDIKAYGETDPELLADMTEGAELCQKFAVNLSTLSKIKTPTPLGLKQMVLFFKCMQKKKMAACMKKDFRNNPHKFELQGLDGILDGYAEPDEQMLIVAKTFFKYGDDELSYLRH